MTFQNLEAPPTPSGFRGKNKVLVQIWYLTEALLFRPTPAVLNRWRVWLLRLFGARIGRGVKVRSSVRVLYPWNLRIGDFTYIADEVYLYSLDRIHVGSHVSLSFGAVLCAGSHDLEDPSFPLLIAPIVIEDEAWVGAQAFVMPGTTVGAGAVIGARSLVTASVPTNEVWVGMPARFVRLRQRQGGG